MHMRVITGSGQLTHRTLSPAFGNRGRNGIIGRDTQESAVLHHYVDPTLRVLRQNGYRRLGSKWYRTGCHCVEHGPSFLRVSSAMRREVNTILLGKGHVDALRLK